MREVFRRKVGQEGTAGEVSGQVVVYPMQQAEQLVQEGYFI